MKGRVIALDHIDGRAAAALLVDGVLEDILIDPPETLGLPPETLLRGVLGRPVKGMGGMMVRLPDGASGLLRGVKGIADGTALLVQVSGVVEAGKAVPLTDRILFKGRYGILTPSAPGLNISRGIKDEEERGRLRILAEEVFEDSPLPDTCGMILRSAAEGVDEDALLEELSSLVGIATAVLADATGTPEVLVDAPDAHTLAWRDWAVPEPDAVEDRSGSFEDLGVWEALEARESGLWPLPGGASVSVEQTRALVAVDVNTGADFSPAAGLKANLAAARALPRLLRLTGLGGQITVDPAPMPKGDRKRWEDALRAAFRADSTDTVLAGWTPLGHFELRRKRDRWPLTELLK